MEKNKFEFKVKDIVIGSSCYHGYSKLFVERVTKTQAILNNGTRLRINVNNSTSIGSEGYHRTSYCLATPQLIESYNRQQLELKFNNCLKKLELKKVNSEDLNKLISLINKITWKI
jgi:DNA replicative helicase MCM subunit Mcm2 (Cdc46/Mcm family)